MVLEGDEVINLADRQESTKSITEVKSLQKDRRELFEFLIIIGPFGKNKHQHSLDDLVVTPER